MKHSSRLIALLAALAIVLVAAPTAQAEMATSGRTAPAADADEAKDEPSASDRRAASSDFEREKLDQSAFDKADSEAKGETEESEGGGSGSVMRALLGFIVVLGAIFGIHWLLKKWGQSKLQGVAGTAGVIDVVATTALAQGRALHLVRVGEELVLVGATEQSITRIGDVDSGVLGAQMGGKGNGEFQAMLSGAMFGSQPGVPNGMGGAASAREPFVKRFIDNLRLTTAR